MATGCRTESLITESVSMVEVATTVGPRGVGFRGGSTSHHRGVCLGVTMVSGRTGTVTEKRFFMTTPDGYQIFVTIRVLENLRSRVLRQSYHSLARDR